MVSQHCPGRWYINISRGDRIYNTAGAHGLRLQQCGSPKGVPYKSFIFAQEKTINNVTNFAQRAKIIILNLVLRIFCAFFFCRAKTKALGPSIIFIFVINLLFAQHPCTCWDQHHQKHTTQNQHHTTPPDMEQGRANSRNNSNKSTPDSMPCANNEHKNNTQWM